MIELYNNCVLGDLSAKLMWGLLATGIAMLDHSNDLVLRVILLLVLVVFLAFALAHGPNNGSCEATSGKKICGSPFDKHDRGI